MIKTMSTNQYFEDRFKAAIASNRGDSKVLPPIHHLKTPTVV